MSSQYTQSQKGKQRAAVAHHSASDSGSEDEEDAPQAARPSNSAAQRRYGGGQAPDAPRASEPDDIPRPAGLEQAGPSPPFGALTSLLEYFQSHLRSKGKKPADKGKMLGEFFDYWRTHVGKDLYPVVRLLLPDRDNRRRNYSLKEQKLAKALIKALDLPPGSKDAMRLTSWKVPTTEDPGAGEFSTVAYEAIQPRSTVITEMGSMSIDQVNDCLDELAKAPLWRASTKRKEAVGEAHARILKDCVSKMTPTEMKWFMRIILRDLKVSISERTVFNALHPDAVDAFNTCSDIKSVCWTLWDTTMRLKSEDKDISLNKAFKPMLCYRNQRDLSSIVKAMRAPASRPPAYDAPRSAEDRNNPLFCTKDEFLVEEKLDGERMQLHKSGYRWSYMSRKGTQYTHHYGQNSAEGSLTPYIHMLFKPEIIDVILDGEMLVWEPRMGKYMPFGNLKSFSTKTHFGPTDPRPVFKVFDVLYMRTTRGAQSLLEVPLYKRKQLLQSIFTPKKAVLEFADTTKASTTAELKNFLERILEERGEGLVVKHPLSSYILAGRQQTWIKLKPDYMDELGEAVPGMVIGGYWGQGGRGGYLASFLIGLRDDKKPVDADGNPHYASFAKVGTGFKLEDYQWIQENTRDKATGRNFFFDFNRKKLPSFFSTVNEYPDQLIAPQDSFLIEVKAAEIVPGKDYAAGFTFRFPRAKFVYKRAEERHEKLEKAMSLQDVKDLKKKVRKVVGSDLSGKNKRSKIATAASMRPQYVSKPVGNYEEKTKIFEGLKFYVHNLKHLDKTKDFVDKDALQKMILENGGDYIQRIPDPSPQRRVIASQLQGVMNKAGSDTADILLPGWVIESVKRRRCLLMTKRFFVKATDETQLSEEYNAAEVDVSDDDQMDQDEDVKVKQEDDLDVSDAETDKVLKPLLGRMNISAATEDPAAPPRERWHDNASDDAQSSASEPEPDTDDEDDGDDKVAPSLTGAEIKPMQTQVDAMALTDARPGLGAGEEMMQYDPDTVFDRLVAYFDSSVNAEANGLAPSKETQAEQTRADRALAGAREAFVSNGGIATDNLLDPKLTHLVVYNTVRDRFKELIRKTMEPRSRKMCTHDWILDSVDESAVVDEADYKP